MHHGARLPGHEAWRGPAGHIRIRLRHESFANHAGDTLLGYLPTANISV